ncbi:MAG: transposase [Polaromonas sp.]|nr:transposase [Polaromonas sp.]
MTVIAYMDDAVIDQVQAAARKRILRAFVGRSLIESLDAKEMAGKRTDLVLTPLVLIERIAALVPPRTHRHRYFGVLAPNVPLSAAVTAMSLGAPAQVMPEQPEQSAAANGTPGIAVAASGGAVLQPAKTVKRSPARYLWAALIARIYEVFPLLCPMCGGQMRLIAFITEGAQIRKILEHIGEACEPPHISPARGPPLWDDCNAQMGEGVEGQPDWDLAAQPAPDYDVDQRINW